MEGWDASKKNIKGRESPRKKGWIFSKYKKKKKKTGGENSGLPCKEP